MPLNPLPTPFLFTRGPSRAVSIYLECPLGNGGRDFSRISFRAANGISLFPVERENVQKRTFTRWINLHLEKVSGVLGWGFDNWRVRP